ncbi:MAG: acylneuraminate cytidylyltransferase family protein [Methanoregula sp.]
MNTKKYRILGITLARGGSKGVPHKNIRPILGIPLIAYTIAEAKQSAFISRYIISTDDPEIQKVAIEYGADAPFLRPAHLATDEATSLDAMKHTVEWAETEEGIPYDFVVELMCTNPMKITADIDAAIEKLIKTGADSVIGVTKLNDHHPARIKKIVDDRIVDFCVPELSSRRQDLKPDAYIRNGSIYAMTRNVLMVKNARYGTTDSRPYYMPDERSVNVDSIMDFYIAELLMKQDPRPYVVDFKTTNLLKQRSD